MTRLEANRELVAKLLLLVEEYPDARFGQILRNAGFVRELRPVSPDVGVDWKNEFYLESKELLARVND